MEERHGWLLKLPSPPRSHLDRYLNRAPNERWTGVFNGWLRTFLNERNRLSVSASQPAVVVAVAAMAYDAASVCSELKFKGLRWQ